MTSLGSWTTRVYRPQLTNGNASTQIALYLRSSGQDFACIQGKTRLKRPLSTPHNQAYYVSQQLRFISQRSMDFIDTLYQGLFRWCGTVHNHVNPHCLMHPSSLTAFTRHDWSDPDACCNESKDTHQSAYLKKYSSYCWIDLCCPKPKHFAAASPLPTCTCHWKLSACSDLRRQAGDRQEHRSGCLAKFPHPEP